MRHVTEETEARDQSSRFFQGREIGEIVRIRLRDIGFELKVCYEKSPSDQVRKRFIQQQNPKLATPDCVFEQ